MAELKTRPNAASVSEFIARIDDPQRREDCQTLLEIMREIVKAEPVMWGDSIVGLGDYHYRYATGREGDWFVCGFSPRKQALTMYLMCLEGCQQELDRLGTFKSGKGCLYVKRLGDLHLPMLKRLIRATVRRAKQVDKSARQAEAHTPAERSTRSSSQSAPAAKKSGKPKAPTNSKPSAKQTRPRAKRSE